MSFYVDNKGAVQQVQIDPNIYKAALDAKLTVPQYLNRLHPDADTKLGSAATQIFASDGLAMQGKNPLGITSPSVADILDGKAGFEAAGSSTTKSQGAPFGNSSRILFPAAVVAMIESSLDKDRTTDTNIFNQMVGQDLTVAQENFEQPIVNSSRAGGPESAKAQRVAQLAMPPAMLSFTTSDKSRRLPTFAIGAEFSDQALRATTLDMVVMTMSRFLEVERDERNYSYLSALFSGDADLITGAVAAVTTTSLDAAATGGVVTHKAWLKFLARNRRFRTITHLAGDINAYLAVESRTGRPGSNNYDPTLERIDPQARVLNQGFGNDVVWWITDTAAEGGPVPANTVWAVDKRNAITRVTNVAAAYEAAEEFALKRSKAMRLDWSEAVYRTFGDSELRAFDSLTIA